MSPDVTIPNRSLFKPSEVCSIAGVQPYILRSWEAEFPQLGRSAQKNGARVYRRADVEMVLRIKDLVFGQGLTLGAARRRIEADEAVGSAEADPELGELLSADVSQRLAEMKKGLRAILDLLSRSGASQGGAGESAEPQTAGAAEKTAKSSKVAKERTA